MLNKYYLLIAIKFLIFSGLIFLPIRQSQATLIPFINEFHYDNVGADQHEFIELAGLIDTNLNGWTLTLYNGSNSKAYKNISLSGLNFQNNNNGFGFVSLNINGIQNGNADGIALTNAANELIQFISYEGALTAIDGLAQGVTSNDIGVNELSTTPLAFSLQLAGVGNKQEDFTWQAAQFNSMGVVNHQQVFTSLHSNNNNGGQPISQVSEPSNDSLLLTNLCLLLLLRLKKAN